MLLTLPRRAAPHLAAPPIRITRAQMNTQRFTSIWQRVCFLVAMVAVASAPQASAATVPAGFTEIPVATGLSSPTAMQVAPDGRLFVCEQGGSLRIIKDGALLPDPFVTLNVNAEGERGLLGVAFDPSFATNRFVYVYYTTTTPPVHNRISRFTANGDVAEAGSEVVILELDDASGSSVHNGGALAFGPDGKLYAAVGENSIGQNAQSLGNLLGKMLRLNADGSIPSDNPFFGTASGRNRAIWALGLRNPFTFAFNPLGTEMFINDVGAGAWEEIDEGRAGANYGWPDTEGTTGDSRFTSPRLAYGHGDGSCAITGGAFYSPLVPQFPADYAGDYFFADYCGGWIRRLDPAAGNSVVGFATGISSPVDLKVADDGSLYYLARGTGASTGVVVRIVRATSAPSITLHPADATVQPGAPVTFSVQASGPAPLRYQWQRNGADVAGSTGSTFTIGAAAPADHGARFRVIVSNDHGNALSNDAVLTVTPNQAPVATITLPAAAALYGGGSSISYAGAATDAEDGTLPPEAFTWRVDFHHDTHVHPFILPTSGASAGSFVVPTTGHTAANVWYRIYLTVRDSDNLSHTTERDVLPRIVRLTLDTNPPGLQLKLDDQPVVTPHAFDSVVGVVRTLEAVTPQSSGGATYEWDSWSDGGAQGHALSTPAANTGYTATYGVTDGGGGGGGGGGDGLSATYFDNRDFTGAEVTRVDPTIDFPWGSGAPAATMQADTFSARWTGEIDPPFSESYTFYTHSDDGVRLWVNGSLIVDNWTDHPAVEDSGAITLTGGQRVPIVMEYYQNAGGATARLSWSSASIGKSVVPSARLYSGSALRSPGGQTLFLSDLPWTSMVSGWGPAERDRSNGEAAPGDGRPLSLGGASFAKGLGVHAPADLRYGLPPGCTQFQAQIGVDDETGGRGRVAFEVWADGVSLYTSPVLTGAGATALLDLPLSGQSDLRLVVTGDGD
ncbi:MAG: hypothetical protein GEU82_13880, partial [Luteitalea sp.]|nr:hypothetical protein [Luteitalea sp.]